MGRTISDDYRGVARAIGNIYELRQCPYEFSHFIKSIRFHKHIYQCRERHPEVAKGIQICDYDQSHHIPKDKMVNHLKECRAYHAWVLNRVKAGLSPNWAAIPQDKHCNKKYSVATKAEMVEPDQKYLEEWI